MRRDGADNTATGVFDFNELGEAVERSQVVALWKAPEGPGPAQTRMNGVWLGLARVCAHAARRVRGSWERAA
jgi:hypothetical protein